MRIIPLILLLTVSAVLEGCNTSGCTENQSAIPLAGYYSSATSKPIILSSLQVAGVDAPNDSVLYPLGEARSEIYLPLRSARNTTAFTLTYFPDKEDTSLSVTDTLRLSYTSEPRLVSEECGAMYFYRITSLSHTGAIIDSVTILDSLVTNTNVQRLHIYFRTQP